MNIAETIVPEWYLTAKERGDSEEALIEQVRSFCQKAIIRRAQKNGLESDETVDNSLVEMTIKTYEYALQNTNIIKEK